MTSKNSALENDMLVKAVQHDATVLENAHTNSGDGTMPGAITTDGSNMDKNTAGDEDDDGYNEDEDDDYVGDNDGNADKGSNEDIDAANKDEDDDEDDEYIVEEDKKEMAKYSSIESSEGGLIKTRKQRQKEEEEAKNKKKDLSLRSSNGSTKSNVNIDSIWAELNSSSKISTSSPLASTATATSSSSISKSSSPVNETGKTKTYVNGSEKIKITSSYEFAGKTITEEKLVDADSEEAKAYLNSSKLTSKLESPLSANDTQQGTNNKPKPLLKRRRKRESLLDAVISNSSKTKLSTLEKSRLDWATYVDKNKISDELKYTNKDGFLEKQDFLNRVDSRRDDIYKDAKNKTTKN